MSELRPYRFGTGLQAMSRESLLEQVKKAEALGYNSVIVTDHVAGARLAPPGHGNPQSRRGTIGWPVGVHYIAD